MQKRDRGAGGRWGIALVVVLLSIGIVLLSVTSCGDRRHADDDPPKRDAPPVESQEPAPALAAFMKGR